MGTGSDIDLTHVSLLKFVGYRRFRVFSPVCTLHAAITHEISVLERRRLTHDYAIGIHMRLLCSSIVITLVIAECNVQSGLKTLKGL